MSLTKDLRADYRELCALTCAQPCCLLTRSMVEVLKERDGSVGRTLHASTHAKAETDTLRVAGPSDSYFGFLMELVREANNHGRASPSRAAVSHRSRKEKASLHGARLSLRVLTEPRPIASHRISQKGSRQDPWVLACCW